MLQFPARGEEKKPGSSTDTSIARTYQLVEFKRENRESDIFVFIQSKRYSPEPTAENACKICCGADICRAGVATWLSFRGQLCQREQTKLAIKQESVEKIRVLRHMQSWNLSLQPFIAATSPVEKREA